MTATYRGDKLLVEVSNGGRWAPCAYLYRIVDEDVHRACMAQVAEVSGDPEPDDYRSDNVLMYEDGVQEFVPARYLRDLADGWDVRFFLDGWEACSYYGYDCGDEIDYRAILAAARARVGSLSPLSWRAVGAYRRKGMRWTL